MRRELWLTAAVCLGCARGPQKGDSLRAPTTADQQPQTVLSTFADAVDAGDFAAAYHLLAPKLRGRYTPERLREDFHREPLAGDRLKLLRRAAKTSPRVDETGAVFQLENGGEARLVRENQGFRIDSLE